MLLVAPPSEVCGVEVNTDFKWWLLYVGRVLQSRTLHEHEKIDIVLFNVFGDMSGCSDAEVVERYAALIDFYSCGWEDRGLEPPKEELYHWERDSQAIWGDFRVYARIDLDDTQMHWWEFRAIFDSLPPDSQIKRLIQVRSEDPADYAGKGMEKERQRLRKRKRAAAVWADEEDVDLEFMAGGG